MYKNYSTQWDAESDHDKDSLNSSFWSDGERREVEEEEEEKVEVERVTGEEDCKPVGDAEESRPEASEKEEVEIERMIREEESKPVTDTEESYDDASEEQEEVGEEDSTPSGSSEEEDERVSGEEDSTPGGSSEEEDERVSGEEDSTPAGGSEKEEEQNKRVSGEEDSTPVADTEDSFQDASEEEMEIGEEDSTPGGISEEENERESSEEESRAVGDSEDSFQETSDEEEEEEEFEHVSGEEVSNPVAGTEDSHQEEEETKRVSREEESKATGDTDDSFQETSEEEEEEEEFEHVSGEEESKPVGNTEDSHQEASEEEEEVERVMREEEFKPDGDAKDCDQEKPDLNNQVSVSGPRLEGGRDDDDDDDEERRSGSSDSPAPSLMTSGYGTYRPEEQEGGDYRDDHTITEFDQDSRGDLSEVRDDEEDDRSLCSFSRFDVEPTEPGFLETPLNALVDAEPEANVARCGEDDDDDEEVEVTDLKPEGDDVQAGEEKCEYAASNEEEQRYCYSVAEDNLEVKHLEGGRKRNERPEEVAQDLKEAEDKVESEDPDESSSNKDIKFIDSKVDFSRMTFDEMCEEWEGNLRQKKEAASCLEDRLADLQLSSPAQRDVFETESEDVSGHSDAQSSETEGVSFSAFESYIRGMTRTQSDGDLRPKPKSFIRPVMSQQTIKKTDPVAKYFQYKQLWEMFKLPGEKDRRALRSEIKERLAYQPPPPKPRRVYVPNTYVVPTEKKRSALRWEIRNDLANGLLPHKFSYRF